MLGSVADFRLVSIRQKTKCLAPWFDKLPSRSGLCDVGGQPITKPHGACVLYCGDDSVRVLSVNVGRRDVLGEGPEISQLFFSK